MRWFSVVACVTLAAAGCSGRSVQGTPSRPLPSPSVTRTVSAQMAGTGTALASSPTPRPAPAPSATPDLSPHFRILPPAEQSALPPPGGDLSTWYRVLDLQSGRVQVLEVDAGGLPHLTDYSFPFNVQWLDDETLAVTTAAGMFRASLDGAPPVLGPTPTPGPAAPPWPAISADGAWSANYDSRYGIDVSPTGASPSLRLTNTYTPQWAPAGHLIAFVGDVCAGMHLYAFDPASELLTNLTADLHAGAFDFVWKPDGSAIAVFTGGVVNGNERRAIELIVVPSGAVTTLVEMGQSGEVIPVAWSPDGQRLLYIERSSGRGFCDGFAGTPEPTRLETLP